MLLRLDKILVDRGLAHSRESARLLIEAGLVTVDGLVRNKAASLFESESVIAVAKTDNDNQWVSRGAHKLLRALDLWKIEPLGWQCVDIGASTGGFTQVLLSRGARRVAAVDVGYGQLAWQLRNDPKVAVFERTNARYITSAEIGYRADLLTCDASFISLKLLLANFRELTADDGQVVTLVKPQFEVGRERVGKGVVRDPKLHAEVLESVAVYAEEADFTLHDATYSPIRGPEGNIEFLFYLLPGRGEQRTPTVDFEQLVSIAHEMTEQDPGLRPDPPGNSVPRTPGL